MIVRKKNMIKCMWIIAFVAICILISPQMIKASVKDQVVSQEYVQQIEIAQDDITKYGFSSAFKRTLKNAADSGRLHNDQGLVKIVAPAGNYEINSSIQINYNNITVDFTGCTFIQQQGTTTNLLRIGENNDQHTGYFYQNITIIGGTFDCNGCSNTLFKCAHAQNITILGASFQNVNNGHLAEVAGINGLIFSDCLFKDQKLENKGTTLTYEAIQIDILTHDHLYGYRAEALAMKNVLIENCVFDNVPRGVGSHTSIINCPVNGIVIRNNTFRNIGSVAVQGQNWINADIHDNQISDSPRGIALYSIGQSGNYIPSDIAKEDGVNTNISDSYKKPLEKQNINIYNNTIICGGQDPYASYDPVGIYVGGLKIPKSQKIVNGSVLPKGNYYVSGVTIKNNTIQSVGHGIRLEDVKKTVVISNSMKFVGTKSSKAFYGVQLRLESQCSQIKNNKINGYNANGIYLNLKSSATTISGNKISNVQKYGIGIEESKVTNIVKNSVTNAKRYGINVIEHSKVTTIADNKISKCKEKMHISVNSKVKKVKN